MPPPHGTIHVQTQRSAARWSPSSLRFMGNQGSSERHKGRRIHVPPHAPNDRGAPTTCWELTSSHSSAPALRTTPRRCFLPVSLHAHSPSSRRQAGARMARAIKAQRCRQNTKAPHPAWRRPREKPPPTGTGAFARKRPDDDVGSVLCGPLQDDQRDPHVLLTTRHNTCRTRTDAAAAEAGRSPASACRRSRFPQNPR